MNQSGHSIIVAMVAANWDNDAAAQRASEANGQ